MRTKVAIIGAGPSGLLLGQLLQRVGEVGRAHLLQHDQQRFGALGGAGVDEPADLLPVELVELAAPAQLSTVPRQVQAPELVASATDSLLELELPEAAGS